ncbi:MAG: hypothetical protein A3G87_08800 [Omnitrophica bacterium RIFCSPLOWO2_12_FULL_50_11]|nr:MAG: hypothetical protein A3G87_08800 [Omnitrophica bacterium RIFCSPLOWO2_12_FULL_50_11]
MDYEPYRRAVRKKVCEHCVDFSEEGRCALTGEYQCGVELYLEKIVDVVRSVHSPHVQDYVTRLRERVCAFCKNQNPDGACRLRSEADCGLDRYFALVVEAIEEADMK